MQKRPIPADQPEQSAKQSTQERPSKKQAPAEARENTAKEKSEVSEETQVKLKTPEELEEEDRLAWDRLGLKPTFFVSRRSSSASSLQPSSGYSSPSLHYSDGCCE